MAQNSRLGGPSITPEEAADPFPPERPVRVRRPELGLVDQAPFAADEEEVPPSPETDGTDSNPSSEKGSTPSGRPKANRRKPAPTTENRSAAQDKEMDSTADSTGGDTRTTETESADEEDEFDFDEFK